MLSPNNGKHAVRRVRPSQSIKDPGTSAVYRHAPAHDLTTMSSSRARPPKRQRTFGAPTEDDDPTAQLSQARYKNAASTRTVGGPLPTLTTCCARAFVRHIEKLSADPNSWEAVLMWLKLIPEPLVPKLFAMLKSTHPTLLKSEFIVCVSAYAKFPECVNSPLYSP